MFVLVTGGSKSGKSRIAESLLCEQTGSKLYLATMEPYGQEAQDAINRHRRMRQGKGFETCERYTDVGGIVFSDWPDAVLLECIGNLCANEMFSDNGIHEQVAEKITQDIRKLAAKTKLFVAVTNQVGEDGMTYTEETMTYIRVLGEINARLAEEADVVIESVCGIPVYRKSVEYRQRGDGRI